MAPASHPLDQPIRELELRIDRLRALYEQYFMGVERLEPHVARNDVEKRIMELRKAKFNNTAKRFKFQTLVQRYNTMQQYWSRTCREIENGTYRRQKLRAERRFGTIDEVKEKAVVKEKEPPQESATEALQNDLAALLDNQVDLEKELADALNDVENMGSPLSAMKSAQVAPLAPLTSASPSSTLSDLEPKSAKSSRGGLLSKLKASPLSNADAGVVPSQAAVTLKASGPPAPPKTRANTQSATVDSAISRDRIQTLHQAYLDARRKTNARDVSFEKLERKIRETEKTLKASHSGRQVDFDVVIKNGKAILKPKLK